MTLPPPHISYDFVMRSLIKEAMRKRKVNYHQLWQRLKKAGFDEPNADSLKNKINRGKFSAAFLGQAMLVLQVARIEFEGGRLKFVYS